MRNLSSLNHYSAKIGDWNLNFIEHLNSHAMQDGVNCLGGGPDAERVTQIN